MALIFYQAIIYETVRLVSSLWTSLNFPFWLQFEVSLPAYLCRRLCVVLCLRWDQVANCKQEQNMFVLGIFSHFFMRTKISAQRTAAAKLDSATNGIAELNAD